MHEAQDITRLRVLVVGDLQCDELYLQDYLRLAADHVEICWTGSGAQLRLRLEQPWHLIICVPAHSGPDSATVLKAVAKNHLAIPVIVISDVSGTGPAVEAMKLGAADYLLADELPRLPAAVRAVVQSGVPVGTVPVEAHSLEASRSRLQTILENEPECVKVVSADGLVLEMNPAGLSLVEADVPDEVIGKPILPLIHEDDREIYHQLHQQALAGDAGRLQFRINALKGTERWMETHSVPVPDADGKSAVLSITRDISQQKKSTELLMETETRFRQLAENIREVFWLIDMHNGDLLYVSPAFDEIWGFDRSALYQQPMYWAQFVHPDDKSDLLEALEKSEQGRMIEHEYRIIRPDGAQRWLRARTFPVRNAAGEVYRTAGIVEDITQRKQAEEELRFQAMFDAVTRLPARGIFAEHLQSEMDRAGFSGENLAVLLLDIDRFKDINESIGHNSADHVLAEVADRLRPLLSSEQHATRLFGATFALMLHQPGDTEHATRLATRIMEMFDDPMMVDGLECFIHVSIGIASLSEQTRSAEELLANADAAMCEAKKKGSGNFEVYDDRMKADFARNRLLESGLRTALEQQQMMLHFQPRLCIASGAVVGAEALLRWRHPELGMVPPDQFIPLAERTGQISSIGTWVLREALTCLKNWHEAELDWLTVSVNVSVRQLLHRDFDQIVSRILEECGVPAGHLELEITESTLMHDVEEMAEVLERLGALGIRIAIDDFGTGYSSLSYITRLPIHKLKIDRSFVSDLPDNTSNAAIVTAILSMAQRLGIRVTAEGVEEEHQLAFIAKHNCEEYQGFHASRPVPEPQFLDFLNGRPPPQMQGPGTGNGQQGAGTGWGRDGTT